MSKRLFGRLAVRINVAIATFILVGLLVGLGFVYSVPVGYGNDEPVHALKASAVAQGDFFPVKIGLWQTTKGTPINVYGGHAPISLINLERAANDSKLSTACTATYCTKPAQNSLETYHQAAKQQLNANQRQLTDFWGANSYSPLGYLPSAAGFAIAGVLNTSVETAVYMARAGNLLLCIAIVGFALYLLRSSKLRWLLLAVALFPLSILSMASLSVDGTLLSLSMLLFALALRSQQKDGLSKILTALLIAACIALPLIKLPYILLSLFCLWTALRPDKDGKIFGLTAAPVKAASFLAVLLGTFIWSYISGDAALTQSLTTYSGTSEPNMRQQLLHIISHPASFMATFFVSILTDDPFMGIAHLTQQSGLSLPYGLVAAGYIYVLLAALYASGEKTLNRKFAVMLTATCLVFILGVYTSMYLSYNSVGASQIAGVQGRYFLPLIPFLALALAMLYPIRITTPRSAKYLFVGAMSITTVVAFIYYVSIVH